MVGRNVEAAWQHGVETFTFWWGSTANLIKRDAAEVAVITGCLDEWLQTTASALLRKHDARFDVFGRWRELCPEIATGVAAAQAAAGSGNKRLVLLIAYDGREEILAAARQTDKSCDLEAFGRSMWTGTLPPVDLLIRTGGEPHLSAGFMLWRIAEAQLAFPKRMWPEFDPTALCALLDTMARTERRFGR